MIDITLDNLQTDLIAASLQTPVLLDIWAPWCGPCKQLGPVLERLEAAYGGRFILAKLNSDEQPQISSQLSQMFGVRSIPFCVMFAGGQPVDGFVGAIPEAEIRTFLDKHVPSESTLEAEADLEEAEDALAQGDTGQAEAKLIAALEADPANEVARLDLVKLLIGAGRLDEAQETFLPINGKASGLMPDARVTAFSHYLAAAQVMRQSKRSVADLEALISANKRDFEARFELAQQHFGAARFTDAMEALLEIIMRDKGWNEDLARRTYVAILEVMAKPTPKAAVTETKGTLELAGKATVVPSDPVIDQYRRKLSMALF